MWLKKKKNWKSRKWRKEVGKEKSDADKKTLWMSWNRKWLLHFSRFRWSDKLSFAIYMKKLSGKFFIMNLNDHQHDLYFQENCFSDKIPETFCFHCNRWTGLTLRETVIENLKRFTFENWFQKVLKEKLTESLIIF